MVRTVLYVPTYTLANPLLIHNFAKRMTALNGDYFDPAIIDPSLTWAENIEVAKRHHLLTCKNGDDEPP